MKIKLYKVNNNLLTLYNTLMHCTQPFLKNQRFFKKSYNLSAGNTNDSKIFFNQLDNFINISAI